MKFRRLILLLVVLFPIADAASKGEDVLIPGPTEWVRIRHPELSLTLEVPAESDISRVRRFNLAPMLRVGKIRPAVTMFRLPGPDTAKGGSSVIDIVLLWLTPAFSGVHANWLAALPDRIQEPEFVSQGLRRALYRKIPKVELTDRGDDLIDGRRSRKLSIGRLLGVRSGRARMVRGGAIVVPVSRDAAVVAMARFSRNFSPEEQALLLDQVAGSLQIAVWGHPPRETLTADVPDPGPRKPVDRPGVQVGSQTLRPDA